MIGSGEVGEVQEGAMQKNVKASKKGKKWRRSDSVKRGFFGNVEYLVNQKGNIIEIKASNGIFRIRSHPFSRGGAHHP